MMYLKRHVYRVFARAQIFCRNDLLDVLNAPFLADALHFRFY